MKPTTLVTVVALVLTATAVEAQRGGRAAGQAQAPEEPQEVVSFGPTPRQALLVGEKSGGRLVIIDPETLEIVARIPAGGNLHEVAADSRYAYVGSRWPGITTIDLVEQRFDRAIDPGALGSFHGLWVANGKLYVGHERSNIVSRYDPVSRTFDMALGTPGGSHLLRVTEDERTMYMASSGAEQVIVAQADENARAGWRFTTFPGDTRMEGFDISPDGRELWALNMNDSSISVINLDAMQFVTRLPFEGGLNNRIRFTKDGRYVLMNELNGTEMLVWDTATRTITRRIDVGAGGEGIFIDPVRPRAYYAVSRGNKLAVIDTTSLTLVKEIPDLDNPDGMAWYAAD